MTIRTPPYYIDRYSNGYTLRTYKDYLAARRDKAWYNTDLWQRKWLMLYRKEDTGNILKYSMRQKLRYYLKKPISEENRAWHKYHDWLSIWYKEKEHQYGN